MTTYESPAATGSPAIKPATRTKVARLSTGADTWVRVKPSITPDNDEMLIIAKGLKRELLAIMEPAFAVGPGLCLRALVGILRNSEALHEASQRRYDLTLADILANGWGYGDEISQADTEDSLSAAHHSACYQAMRGVAPVLAIVDKLPFEVIEAEAVDTWNANNPMVPQLTPMEVTA